MYGKYNIIVLSDRAKGIQWSHKKTPSMVLPEHKDWIRELTSNAIIVLGKDTYLFSKSWLPKTNTIVLSKDNYEYFTSDKMPTHVLGAKSFDEADELIEKILQYTPKEVYILGGSSVFEHYLPETKKIYWTELKTFPRIANAYNFFPITKEQEHCFRAVKFYPFFGGKMTSSTGKKFSRYIYVREEEEV